ncbi:SRPBCC family protein [Sphingomonas cavernae]|uniref:ATPase n=1 Tax=Sphingomonas cavernae TaxID=2320861 RepID=A0A418WRT0_9SPHN|nr:SRPBCC family protein [Sphingomonas cavernae]RJF93963.1 ATPase [Sphingomonas cavernae]
MSNALTITNKGDTEIVITRQFDAPRHLVFEAMTVPALVRRWLLGPEGWSMPVCEINLSVGGHYRYEWLNADGRTMGMGGTFREIVVPERIVHTELFDEDWTGGETLCTQEFVEAGACTTLVTTVIYSSTAARDAALRSGMAGGMETGYARLDAIFAERLAKEEAQ